VEHLKVKSGLNINIAVYRYSNGQKNHAVYNGQHYHLFCLREIDVAEHLAKSREIWDNNLSTFLRFNYRDGASLTDVTLRLQHLWLR